MSRNFSGELNPYIPKCPVIRCYGRTPECLETFVVSRVGQKQCVNCLKFKNILDNFPKL